MLAGYLVLQIGVQTSFLKEVKSLVAVIEEMGNSFLEQSQDLLVLDTRDILDPSVGESVRKAEELNEKQYHTNTSLLMRDLLNVRCLLQM